MRRVFDSESIRREIRLDSSQREDLAFIIMNALRAGIDKESGLMELVRSWRGRMRSLGRIRRYRDCYRMEAGSPFRAVGEKDMQERSFGLYLDVIETAVRNINPITASKFKGTLHSNLEDAIFVLAYDSEVLNHLRALDRPAQNLLEAAILSGDDLSRRKAEMLFALGLLRRAMHECPPSPTARSIGLS